MMTAQQRKSSDRLPRFPEPRQNILGWAPKKRGMCSNCASPHKEPVMDSLCHPCLLLPRVAGTDQKRDTGCRSNPRVNKPASTGSTSTTRHGSPPWNPRWGPRHHLGPFHTSTTILVLTHFNSVTPQVAGRPGSQDSQKLFQPPGTVRSTFSQGLKGLMRGKGRCYFTEKASCSLNPRCLQIPPTSTAAFIPENEDCAENKYSCALCCSDGSLEHTAGPQFNTPWMQSCLEQQTSQTRKTHYDKIA